MLSRMKPEYYTSQEHFDKEMREIFHKLWIFAGFKFSLKNNNSFFTREIGGVPIVVQNFEGEIKGFVNSCAHRGARIHKEEFGTRPMQCKYHGWKYDKEGKPCLIPFSDKLYKFSQEVCDNLKMVSVHVKIVGEFIFVNLDKEPLPIQKQFMPALLENLLLLSKKIDHEFVLGNRAAEYNWKLPFENLNDSIHPIFVHPGTITQIVDFGNADGFKAQEIDYESIQLKHLSYTEAVGTFKKSQSRGFQDFVDRFSDQDRYYNWLIYPNLHIASTDGGYSFTFEQYEPLSPSKTNNRAIWMTAKRIKNYSSHRAVSWEFLKTSRAILDEDEEIMELTQAGFNAFSPKMVQGTYESHNKRTEAWYESYLSLKKGL
jgi:phenylpropionate dioxygenase-like ring-hydroxylating dioxygenase large terminal subunit